MTYLRGEGGYSLANIKFFVCTRVAGDKETFRCITFTAVYNFVLYVVL